MSSSLNNIFTVWSFAFGAVIASFLNVVIWRVPRGESIVSPPSHCPKCNARIKWYQNVPVVSYLALRGRCANCGEKISVRYLLIELVGGALFMWAWMRFGMLAPLLWVWISLMMIGTMIDFDHKLLPDFVTVGGMLYGVLVVNLAFPLLLGIGVADLWPGLIRSVAGLALGLGLMWLIRFAGSKAFKREAMGMGDVLLMGAVGSISGMEGVVFVVMVSSLIGSIGGILTMAIGKRWKRNVEIPYGPYICAAHFICIFYGDEIVSWYLRLLGVQA